MKRSRHFHGAVGARARLRQLQEQESKKGKTLGKLNRRAADTYQPGEIVQGKSTGESAAWNEARPYQGTSIPKPSEDQRDSDSAIVERLSAMEGGLDVDKAELLRRTEEREQAWQAKMEAIEARKGNK